MKILRVVFSCLIISVCLAGCSKPDTHDSHGNAIKLSQYAGKWVVINYWATWCKPCIHEMPALEQLYVNNKNKLVVIGVSYDNLSNQEMNAVSKKYKLTYPLTASFPLAKIGVEKTSVLPITFIINPEGKLVKTLKGPQTEEEFAAAVGITATASQNPQQSTGNKKT